MFFEKDNLSVTILDVIELEQKNINVLNDNRNFHALSFRISADTILQTNKKSYYLTDNSICYVPANIKYRRISKKDKLIVIHFNILNYKFNEIEFFNPDKQENYYKLFNQILSYWNNKEIGYKYQCDSVLNEILYECYKENYIAPANIYRIYHSIKFLEDNFKNPDITIDEIAQKSFMSTVYFRKLFKKFYGISPVKYIINLRIENAINLIETGYYSLYEVAKLSGYDDYSYFSSEFKRIKGVSPSKYYYNYGK